MKNTKFEKRNVRFVKNMSKDHRLKNLTRSWFLNGLKHEYSYHFSWLGRPIIQYPQDMIALQEIIWRVKPDLIIETGIAHGGSLIFSASILELIGHGKVLGIDIDIRSSNKKAIEQHPLSNRIRMIEGSSIDEKVVKQVYKFAKNKKRILLSLDSNHTHKHVLQEMNLYSKLVTKGSYMIVCDTIIEDIPPIYEKNSKNPWRKGNNPKTAVLEFLKSNSRFVVDENITNKILITVAPSGYLKCIK